MGAAHPHHSIAGPSRARHRTGRACDVERDSVRTVSLADDAGKSRLAVRRDFLLCDRKRRSRLSTGR
jgi:hypothetical protein